MNTVSMRIVKMIWRRIIIKNISQKGFNMFHLTKIGEEKYGVPRILGWVGKIMLMQYHTYKKVYDDVECKMGFRHVDIEIFYFNICSFGTLIKA